MWCKVYISVTCTRVVFWEGVRCAKGGRPRGPGSGGGGETKTTKERKTYMARHKQRVPEVVLQMNGQSIVVDSHKSSCFCFDGGVHKITTL